MAEVHLENTGDAFLLGNVDCLSLARFNPMHVRGERRDRAMNCAVNAGLAAETFERRQCGVGRCTRAQVRPSSRVACIEFIAAPVRMWAAVSINRNRRDDKLWMRGAEYAAVESVRGALGRRHVMKKNVGTSEHARRYLAALRALVGGAAAAF